MLSQPLHRGHDDTIASVLAHARQRLAATATPRLDSELLLAHVLQAPRTYLYAHPGRILTAQQLAAYEQLLCRRANLEPVAYLTGTREFWSLPLDVTAATLVPRPETELLVELALEHSRDDAVFSLADLGTGSGAIAIALACELKTARIVATDNSDTALQVARGNADRLCPGRIDFRTGDWLQPLAAEKFDMIVSNPPYVAAGDPVLQTTELRHEPRSALAAGTEGLDHLRVLADAARHCLNARGRLLLEHGAEQAQALHALLDYNGYRAIETRTDMAGLARITMAQWPG